jgi:hypothetical protein
LTTLKGSGLYPALATAAAARNAAAKRSSDAGLLHWRLRSMDGYLYE